MKIPVWLIILILLTVAAVAWRKSGTETHHHVDGSPKRNYDSVVAVVNDLQHKIDSAAIVEAKIDTQIIEITHEIPAKIKRIRSLDAINSTKFFLEWTRQYNDSIGWEGHLRDSAGEFN